MIKILFVCHGNICRSPMAACVMKDFVQKAGLGEAIYINSAATSREELGNPIYPPARRTLQDHGIPMDGHRATQLQRQDYDRYDYLVGMDGQNIANMKRILGNDPAGKIYKLLDFTGTGGILQTHGIRGILRPPTGRWFWAARDFWIGSSSP